MYCLCVQKTGIARVYCTPLHKNLIDDGIAFTYIFLFYRLYQLNVCETINRKLMPEITHTYQYKVHTYNAHTSIHALGSHRSAPDTVCVASSWQDFSAKLAEENFFFEPGKRGSKRRFINCAKESANPSRWQN
jgi:hypothetical protein